MKEMPFEKFANFQPNDFGAKAPLIILQIWYNWAKLKKTLGGNTNENA